MKEEIIKLLMSVEGRGQMDALVSTMEMGGFFEAPCSTKHHLCYKGGLAEHSLNVYNCLVKLNDTFDAGLTHDEMVISAILHDLGKMGDYGKPNYIPNFLKSGNRSDKEPYKSNPELMYQEHEIRSLIIASRWIDITEREANAILHHNGLWSKLDSSFGSYFDKDQLSYLLHVADMYCSRFVEVEKEEGNE